MLLPLLGYRTYYLFAYVDFVCVKYDGCKQSHIKTPWKYFVIADLKAILHAQYRGMFIIYLHTKCHIPRHNQ